MKKKSLVSTCIAVAVAVVLTLPSTFVLAADSKLITKEHVQYPIDETTKSVIKEKEKLIDMYKQVKEGKITITDYINAENNFNKSVLKSKAPKKSSVVSLAVSAKYISNLYQQTQINSYYCGPATVSSILGSLGVNITQTSVASSLGTTTNGTDWYNGTYPVQKTLNIKTNTTWYTPYGTNVDANTFRSYVLFDIKNGHGLAGDAYEVVGGNHLIGHPNRNIFHWFAIDGFSDYGDSTHYADSVHGATSISWSGSVPAYSTMATSTIAKIIDGRGVIW